MRPAIFIILFSLLGISVFGIYPAFCLLKCHARAEIKKQLKNGFKAGELTRICIDEHQANLVWEEQGKEFHLNGKLYDVVSQWTTGRVTVYYCLNDQQELRMLRLLADNIHLQLSNDHSPTGRTASHLFKMLFLDYIAPAQLDYITGRFFKASTYHFARCTHPSALNAPAAPPPRHC